MNEQQATIRLARPGDEPGAYRVCLKTGDFGKDGEAFFRDDPDALGRIFVGPYLKFESDFSLILEDARGVCGYALAALDSRRFFERYEKEWRPSLTAKFPKPTGDRSTWTRTQTVHSWYHEPDYFTPEPYERYPSHIHIDLLSHVQGRGYGKRMVNLLLQKLREHRSPGAHLGVSELNVGAQQFYKKMAFTELVRNGSGADAVIYMGKKL